MRVKMVRLQNYLGVEELEIAPGKITRVSGGNAQGKTTIIKALKTLLSGGHDARVIRNGQEEAEVLLVIEDDEGHELEAKTSVNAKRSEFTLKHSEYGKLSGARAWLKERLDPISVNPVAILNADPKEQAQIVLEALPLEIDGATLETIAGEFIDGVGEMTGPAVVLLDEVRKMLFDLRRDLNRDGKKQANTVETLREGLPPESPDGTNWTEEVAARETARDDAQQAQAEALNIATQSRDTAMSDLRNWLQVEKDAARKKFDDAVAEAQAAYEAKHSEIQANDEELRRLAADEFGGAVTEAESALEVARSNQRAADRAHGARDELGKLEAQVEVMRAKSAKLSDALKLIDREKAKLFNDLPLDGLEFKDGEIYVHGVPFNNRSTAERTLLAIQIAKLRTGDLPLILVDGAEALDADTLAAFEDAVRQDESVQLIYTQVTGGDLQWETKD